MQPEMPSGAPLQRALVDFIRRSTAAAEMRKDPRGFFLAHGADSVDADVGLDETLAERFQLYRQLVLGRLREALQVSIPKTLALLGSERVDHELDEFLAVRGPRSAYLRDVAPEFVAFAEVLWVGDKSTPRFIPDLAKHELLSFEVAAAKDDEVVTPIGDISVETVLSFQHATRLAHYGFPVHELPEGPNEVPVLEPRDCSILAYRDTELSVRYLELSDLGAALVTRVMTGEPIGEATANAHLDTESRITDDSLASVAMLLEDLEQRGILRGSQSQKASP